MVSGFQPYTPPKTDIEPENDGLESMIFLFLSGCITLRFPPLIFWGVHSTILGRGNIRNSHVMYGHSKRESHESSPNIKLLSTKTIQCFRYPHVAMLSQYLAMSCPLNLWMMYSPEN